MSIKLKSIVVASALMFALGGCNRDQQDIRAEGVSPVDTDAIDQGVEETNVVSGGDSTMGTINRGTTNQRSTFGQSTTGVTTKGDRTLSGGNLTDESNVDTSNSNSGTSTNKPAMYGKNANTSLVHQAQIELNSRGHSVPVTGILDMQTVQALKDFQKQRKLQETGTLNRDTLQALGVAADGSSDRQPASINQ